jgi:methionyl-tRNA formyltransferase
MSLPAGHPDSVDRATDADRPKIVFFGSGPVAATSLELLLQWCTVEAVITKPQPPHHKQKFPVIAVAEAHDLPLFMASNKRELDELMAQHSFAKTSRVAVLIDFGIIVSQAVIDTFELGVINSHFSLLPEWRGADPITFSILSGQKETGISLMLLVVAMDEGPLLAQATYDLSDDITTPELTEDLIDLSDLTLREILPLYLQSSALPAPQESVALPEHASVSYSRKLNKDDSILDFTKPAIQLEREIRAFADWPKSRTTLAAKDVIITAAHAATASTDAHQPGVVKASPDATHIAIQTSDGVLCVDKLKPAGKPEMTAQAFLAGNKL